jgi:hypothetical protein
MTLFCNNEFRISLQTGKESRDGHNSQSHSQGLSQGNDFKNLQGFIIKVRTVHFQRKEGFFVISRYLSTKER